MQKKKRIRCTGLFLFDTPITSQSVLSCSTLFKICSKTNSVNVGVSLIFSFVFSDKVYFPFCDVLLFLKYKGVAKNSL